MAPQCHPAASLMAPQCHPAARHIALGCAGDLVHIGNAVAVRIRGRVGPGQLDAPGAALGDISEKGRIASQRLGHLGAFRLRRHKRDLRLRPTLLEGAHRLHDASRHRRRRLTAIPGLFHDNGHDVTRIVRRRPRYEHGRVLLLAPQHRIKALRLGRAGLARHPVARVVIALERLRRGTPQPGVGDVAQPLPHDGAPVGKVHDFEHSRLKLEHRFAERLGFARDHRLNDVGREQGAAVGDRGVGVRQLNRRDGDEALPDAGIDVVPGKPARRFVVGVVRLGADLEQRLFHLAVRDPPRFLKRELHTGWRTEAERTSHVLNCPLLGAVDPVEIVGHFVEVGIA